MRILGHFFVWQSAMPFSNSGLRQFRGDQVTDHGIRRRRIAIFL